MPLPNLRESDPLREGITHRTICYDDLMAALFEEYLDEAEGETRSRLFFEAPMVEASKWIDRFTATAESQYATKAVEELDDLMLRMRRISDRADMLKRRIKATRADVNRRWMESKVLRSAGAGHQQPSYSPQAPSPLSGRGSSSGPA